MSSTVELFTVKDEQKERTLAEWLGGLLGLYNTVKVRQIEEGGQHEGGGQDGLGASQRDGSPREGGGEVHRAGNRQAGGHETTHVQGQQGQAGEK